MAKPLYKYIGPEYLDKVFSGPDKITIKCSHPQDFNDPYELFLTIDFNEDPGALAFYQDVVGELPQLPTTCFSRSPSIIPMWAHYAQNLTGVVVELDEEKLIEAFPDSGFGDVDYQDDPHEGLSDMLYRAYRIGKPRYLYLLQGGVFSAAYYTKTSDWAYELERRMVIGEAEVRRTGGLMLADIAKECVTALIVGPRATEATKRATNEQSGLLGCRYMEMRTGRSTAVPFFVDNSGKPHTFDGAQIAQSSSHCEACKEPLSVEATKCSWCLMNDAHRQEAAMRNSFRIMDHYGTLDSYLQNMAAISRGTKKS